MQPIEQAIINYRNMSALARLHWPCLFTLSVFGPSQDHIFKAIKTSGSFYERDLLEEIALHIPQTRGTVLDVGANIGNHSLFFSKVLNKYVISIEPQREALDLLECNMRENNAEGEILRMGMGERRGTATIVNNRQDLGLGAARLTTDQNKDAESVQVSTIDLLCSNRHELSPIQLIKIDTEGMEAQVLRGAADTILKYKPIVVAEAASVDAFNEIASILSRQGYVYSGPFAWTPTYIFITRRLSRLRKFAWHLARMADAISGLRRAA